MAKHRHHELTGEPLRAAARAQVEQRGERWTAMRAQVFDMLALAGRPTSAYDLAETVSVARGKRVAANSVYRILDLFVMANLAIRVESANAYIVNAHPGCSHDCIFLVCQTCGQADHVDDDTLSDQVRERAQRAGFVTARPVIEVLGTCAHCAAAG